jgi:protein SCO1/2
MIRAYAIGAVVVVVAAIIGIPAWMVLSGRQDDRFAQCRSTAIAGGAGAIGGPFELVDHTGRTVTDRDVVTQPSILYFGYTFCPDVCPLDTARNAEAVDLLEQMGHQVQPVFISIDPRRDTPDVLAEFVSFMHPRMIGLTGTEEQVRNASRAYRTYYAIPNPDDEFYLVDHSTFSYLVLPEIGFVEALRRELSPQQMAQTVSCFVQAM